MLLGCTNGDDAVFASEDFVGANDGVGAWATRPRGHAGLWARLILHFWVMAIHGDAAHPSTNPYKPDPVKCLQTAYKDTIAATNAPNDWQGTTTVSGAQLHYEYVQGEHGDESKPVLYVTNLGYSQIMVVRPSEGELVFKTVEQWHWFDCPRQLGTNSPDTPRENAAMDVISIREGDVVLAMSDGVIDNLWSHEIVESVSRSVQRWEAGEGGQTVGGAGDRKGGVNGGMRLVADELMEAAKAIALDPFAESPFMEHAIEEGLASEGGRTVIPPPVLFKVECLRLTHLQGSSMISASLPPSAGETKALDSIIIRACLQKLSFVRMIATSSGVVSGNLPFILVDGVWSKREAYSESVSITCASMKPGSGAHFFS